MRAIGGLFQRLGKALMNAVAVLPVAALLLGLGYWVDPAGWGSGNVLAMVLVGSGQAVLENLGVIFAIAIAYGWSKDGNGSAALSGFIGYTTVTTLLKPENVAVFKHIDDYEALTGDAALQWASHGWAAINGKNVLIGIVVGVLAGWTYNKFHTVKMPDYLAFFGGRRLVPILTAMFSIVLAGVLYFAWPFIYQALFHFGTWIQGLGVVGAGIYGVANRLLIPTGLHHALNAVFWFDIGVNDIGKFLGGADTIEAAANAKTAAECPGVWEQGSCQVEGIIGRYQAGFFPVMMFGLPGAALAMYRNAAPSRKKVVGSLMLAGALTSFLTGVTEPLEFSFMFLAPMLYLVHALLTGLSLAIAAAFHWTTGFAFSAGFIDMVLQARNPLAHQWWMLVVLGVIYFGVYYFAFSFLIRKFNLSTPGRNESEQKAQAGEVQEGDATDGSAAGAQSSQAARILAGLGGAENIDVLEHCATRLRVKVKDDAKVDEERIKQADVVGVVRPSERAVQVIIGPQVEFVYDEVARLRRDSEAQGGVRKQ